MTDRVLSSIRLLGPPSEPVAAVRMDSWCVVGVLVVVLV